MESARISFKKNSLNLFGLELLRSLKQSSQGAGCRLGSSVVMVGTPSVAVKVVFHHAEIYFTQRHCSFAKMMI